MTVKKLGSMGYQKQEFDDDGELISTEEEDDEAFEDDFEEEYEESLDE